MVYVDTVAGEMVIEELTEVIGKVTPHNFSPTCRAKLLGLDVESGLALLEVAENTDSWGKITNELNKDKIGMLYTDYIPYVWNAFFY